MECLVDQSLIRRNIEKYIADRAVATGLFEKLDNQTLIPANAKTELASRVLTYKDQVHGAFQGMLESDPVGFLKFVAEQAYSNQHSSSLVDTLPDGLQVLAIKTFPEIKDAEPIQFTSEVNYRLDAIQKLSSPKAEQVWKSAEKGNWGIDKILNELQIQKTQKELIKTLGTTDREGILQKLMEYEYPVEIKEGLQQVSTEGEYSPDENVYMPPDDYSSWEIPSNYYSNLTVPGGTNYRENRVITPTIEPVRKGHAEFAEKNDIGWFRSDDQIVPGTEYIKEGTWSTPPTEGALRTKVDTVEGTPTKTRRILEIQSDLFQKNREQDLLTDTEVYSAFGNSVYKNDGVTKEIVSTHEDEGDALVHAQILNLDAESKARKTSGNQFLQLLNKDNNWVTFFIKGIIQDSIKKGYENVLFPAGNTAAKIEGHQTLEDYITSKERQIKQIEDSGVTTEHWTLEANDKSGNMGKYSTREEAEEAFNKSSDFVRQHFTVGKNIVDHTPHYENLKRELKDALEGKIAFSTIHRFYEQDIQNILKKRGYNPTHITDEHGNDWFQVDLNDVLKNSVEEKLGKLTSTASHEEVAGSINSNMNEEVMKDLGNGIYRVNASQDLVDDALKVYLKGNPDALGATQETQEHTDDLYERAGVDKNGTPQEFIDKYLPEKEQVQKFLSANPNLKLEWDDDVNSMFDPSSNRIVMSLPEMDAIAQATGLDIREVTAIYLQHELSHAATYYGVETGANDTQLKEWLKIARDWHAAHPFIDDLRQGFVEDGLPYSLKNAHEMMADMFSNPYFQRWAKTVPTEEGSLWDKIINFFRKLLGLSVKDSLYDKVTDYANSDKIRKDNIEGAMTPQTQDMVLYYKGNPTSYMDAAFEYFTSPEVEKLVKDTFKEIPSAITKLKNKVAKSANQSEINHLQNLIDAYNVSKGKEEEVALHIKMLVSAGQIAKDLNAQLLATEDIKDPTKKLQALFSLHLAAENFEDIIPFVNDILSIVDRRGSHSNIRQFMHQLRGISSITNEINHSYIKLASPAVLSYWSSLYPYTDSTTAAINASIKEINDKLTGNINDRERKYLQDKLKGLQKQLLKIPSKEVLQMVFDGKIEDAKAIDMNLLPIQMNSHVLVQTIASRLKDLDIEVTQAMVDVENKHQHEYDKVMKDAHLEVRDPINTWDPIRDVLSFPTEAYEENGELKYKYDDTYMLLSAYESKYLTKAVELQKAKEFYKQKFADAKKDGDEQKKDFYYDKYQEAISIQQSFLKENSEMKYAKEVYDMYELMDRKIPKGNSFTTFRKERGDIFIEIENAEHERDRAVDLDDQNRYQEEVDKGYIKLREIRSLYNEDSSEKTGFERELADIAGQYSEMRNKLGAYILTDKGKASFDRELESLKDRLAKGFITQEQYDAKYNSMTVTELDDTYYERLSEMFKIIDDTISKMMEVPEIAKALRGIDRTKIKEGYKKIRQLVSAFRDNEGVIDGILFSKVRPELVRQIKDIQQEVENLKNAASKLKGLSVNDAIEKNNLVQKNKEGTISEAEKQRLSEFVSEIKAKEKVYKANKQLIDGYYEMLGALSRLTQSSVSSYYLEAKDNELNNLISKERERIEKEMQTSTTLEGGDYYIEDGKWFRVDKIDTNTGVVTRQEIKDEDGLSARQKVIDEIAKKRADQGLTSSDWYNQNHIDTYQWNVKNHEFDVVRAPIYIWVKTEPADKELIKAGQPSIKYKSYKIHDGTIDKTKNYLNPKHSEIYPWIPINKEGKFSNERYNKLASSTDSKNQALHRYLEFLRKDYKDSQSVLPNNKLMGDILPSVYRTEDEAKVAMTKGLLRTQTWDTLFKSVTAKDSDTATLLGGSQDKYNALNRIVPARFTSILNKQEQSANIANSILVFNLAMKRYAAQTELQPIMETTRDVISKLPVLESTKVANKLSIGGLFAAIKGASNTTTVSKTKDTEKTELSKTIDYIMDTFLYEQRKDPAVINMFGMNIDLQRISRELKHLTSLAAFSVNSLVAFKNTGAAKIMSFVNTRISTLKDKGYYTSSDYVKAQAEAASYAKDVITDYKKFGNKSFIGQCLQYFNVLQGSSYNEYGRKTQWTALKDAENILCVLKNVSEFELQLTQFIAMAHANKVMINGNLVPLHKAFMDKNGNFFKNPQVDQEFVKRFIKKVEYVNRLINGAYKMDERNKFQKSVIGDLAFYLNGFIMPGILNRFSGTRYSLEGDIITKGYWNQAFGFIRDLIKYRQGLYKQWNGLNQDEKARVLRFVKELSFIVAMGLLYGAMGGNDDGKDIRQNTPMYNYLLALTLQIKSETETFAPVPSMGIDEFARKLNSPFAAVRQVSNIIKVIDHAYDYVAGNKNGFYQTTGVRDGFHDKGDAKVVADFLRVIGYSGTAFNPADKVIRLRNFQQLR